MQAPAESEIMVQVVSEVEGDVERVARPRALQAIVVTKSGPLQLMPLARLLSGLRNIELSEAARRLESAGGIVLRDAGGEETDAVAAELNRQDVPFVMIPTRELPELIELAQLFRIRVAVGGLRLRRDDGSHMDIKWNNILAVTCVRLEGQSESAAAPARLVLSILTREPLACYQLSENVPQGPVQPSSGAYEPKVRFERLGREIYETFTRSLQNKGMRILASYGLKGRWKGLTFEKPEQVQAYNYWVALLSHFKRKHPRSKKTQFSLPWLRRIEFEAEAVVARPPSQYRLVTDAVPAPAPRPLPPILLTPQEWLPEESLRVGHYTSLFHLATVVAAISLAIYIILEFLW
jgi:hypothetical protein